MKRVERDRAIALRREGRSLNDIVRELNVSKASVSVWVRKIELSEHQKNHLNERGFSIDAIEKRRTSRIANTERRHNFVVHSAKKQIKEISRRELMLIGSALYWGEGGKSLRGGASIANSDPYVIKFMMRFFREIFNVPPEKFRAHIHTFSHLNAREAEKYWSKVTGIPLKQFYKTYSKPSIAGKGKRDSLPYGTIQISVCDTTIFLTIKGWIERLAELGSSRA